MTRSASSIALSRALKDLYDVYSRYARVTLNPVNPCSHDAPKLAAVRDTIARKPLAALTPSDLLDYYYLAVTDIGDVDDLRHFLPRLLDVMITSPGPLLAPAHLPTLLGNACIESWSPEERRAVTAFARLAADEGRLPEDIALKIATIAANR